MGEIRLKNGKEGDKARKGGKAGEKEGKISTGQRKKENRAPTFYGEGFPAQSRRIPSHHLPRPRGTHFPQPEGLCEEHKVVFSMRLSLFLPPDLRFRERDRPHV